VSDVESRYRNQRSARPPMLGLTLLFVTSWAFSVVFGSLGIFFVYMSFLIPNVGAEAVIFLGAATALVWATAPD
jgi:hypothetical protein